MLQADDGSTCPALLGQSNDLKNHEAWARLTARHDRLVRRCCARYGLNDADADDVRQETWFEVARRLERFRYDPERSFRGWLWAVCASKAVSFLRRNNTRRTERLDEWMAALSIDPDSYLHDDSRILCRLPATSPDGSLDTLFKQAERIQAAVRERVAAHTWDAFWMVDVEMRGIKDVAAQLGVSVVVVYKSVQRVRKRLRDEGAKLSQSPSAP